MMALHEYSVIVDDSDGKYMYTNDTWLYYMYSALQMGKFLEEIKNVNIPL